MLFVIITLLTQMVFSQSSEQKLIKTIGVFDGKITTVGNFEAERVYKINEYCIATSDITESRADSLKGKRIMVTGKLKVVVGKTHDAKTSTDGRIYEPYKEPDKKFIVEPTFTIVYDSREPLIESE